MTKTIYIGLIGDYDPAVTAHQAIPKALELAGHALGCSVEPTWLHTSTLQDYVSFQLEGFDGFWCVPASPYVNMDGALRAIQYAREQHKPFLGTCGGFQHALLEFARNVLNLKEAHHAEVNPQGTMPFIAPLACSLVEQSGEIVFNEGSRIRSIYGTANVIEQYHCSYGLNPTYLPLLKGHNLSLTGFDRNGEVRVIELENHPFFIATLFQPERSGLKNVVHPLIKTYLKACVSSS